MENAEKLQNVSGQPESNHSDEVQSNSELNEEKMKKEETNPETEEVSVSSDVAQNPESVEVNGTEATTTEMVDAAQEEVVREEAGAVPLSTDGEASEDDVEVEHEEEEEEDHEEEFDFEHADKGELLKHLKDVRNEEDFRRLDKVLKAIKPRFDELYELEKNEALQRFVSEGNAALITKQPK